MLCPSSVEQHARSQPSALVLGPEGKPGLLRLRGRAAACPSPPPAATFWGGFCSREEATRVRMRMCGE